MKQSEFRKYKFFLAAALAVVSMLTACEWRGAKPGGNPQESVQTASVLPEGETPDYSESSNWAYFALGEDKDADLFLIAPTVYSGDENTYYMSLDDDDTKESFVGALNMERGIYEDSTRMYAPFYRQVGLNVYKFSSDERDLYIDEAYKDVKEAFLYYFEQKNQGRPYLLAGFSQGADLVLRLMEDLFDEEKYTENFIAAYPIGWSYTEDDVRQYPQLKPAQGETDTGVIISFNSEAESVTESLIVGADEKTFSINPLNWKTDDTPADKSLNLGAAFTDYSGAITREIPQLTGAYIDPKRGTLKVTDVTPEEYPPGLDIFGEGIYHLYDYQFFFRNLQENVAKRIQSYEED